MAFEVIEIDEMVAACNGGGGPLGHPRVYLNLMPAGRVLPEIGVATPSAHEAGEERPAESPAPRQSGTP